MSLHLRKLIYGMLLHEMFNRNMTNVCGLVVDKGVLYVIVWQSKKLFYHCWINIDQHKQACNSNGGIYEPNLYRYCIVVVFRKPQAFNFELNGIRNEMRIDKIVFFNHSEPSALVLNSGTQHWIDAMHPLCKLYYIFTQLLHKWSGAAQSSCFSCFLSFKIWWCSFHEKWWSSIKLRFGYKKIRNSKNSSIHSFYMFAYT
jgi:hypothetical protein